MLEGKTAVITGCLKGIGRSTMDLFAAYGANIVACAQFETSEFHDHIKKLESNFGIDIYPLYFDLCDDEAIKNAAKEIKKIKVNIDILVNIAGYTKDANFQMVSMDDMKKIFQINFFSQILFSQYIVRFMKNGGVV